MAHGLPSRLDGPHADPSWRDLTALYHHFETQPIPNPLSRLLHFAPAWLLRLGVLFNFFCELVVPWFVFRPTRLRRIAGAFLVLFQLSLVASGNLSLLNWLTIVPCLACFDDGVWRRRLPARLVARADRSLTERVPCRPQQTITYVLVALVAVLSIGPVVNLASAKQVLKDHGLDDR